MELIPKTLNRRFLCERNGMSEDILYRSTWKLDLKITLLIAQMSAGLFSQDSVEGTLRLQGNTYIGPHPYCIP